jgi:hypothetical protein
MPPEEPARAAPAAAPALGPPPETEAAKRAGPNVRALREKGHATKSSASAGAPAFEAADGKQGLDLDAPIGGLRGAASGAGGGRFAEPPRPRPAAKTSKSIDDLLGDVRPHKPAPPPAEAASDSTLHKAARDDAFAAYPPPAAAAKSEAKKAKVAEESPEPTRRPASLAAQPAPAAAPASAPAPSPPAAPAARRQELEQDMARADQATGAAEMQHAKDKAPAGKSGLSLEESIKKADRLFAGGDYGAAAAAYRDLLDRFPTYKDAARWRERMSQSLVAVEQARKAGDAKAHKAAKAGSSDAVLKEMK